MKEKIPAMAIAAGLIGLIAMAWLLLNHPKRSTDLANVTTHCVAVIGSKPPIEATPMPNGGKHWDKPEEPIDADCQLTRNRRIG
jgi:hypothetical protein